MKNDPWVKKYFEGTFTAKNSPKCTNVGKINHCSLSTNNFDKHYVLVISNYPGTN